MFNKGMIEHMLYIRKLNIEVNDTTIEDLINIMEWCKKHKSKYYDMFLMNTIHEITMQTIAEKYGVSKQYVCRCIQKLDRTIVIRFKLAQAYYNELEDNKYYILVNKYVLEDLHKRALHRSVLRTIECLKRLMQRHSNLYDIYTQYVLCSKSIEQIAEDNYMTKDDIRSSIETARSILINDYGIAKYR